MKQTAVFTVIHGTQRQMMESGSVCQSVRLMRCFSIHCLSHQSEDDDEEDEKVFKLQLLSQFTAEFIHVFCSCRKALFVIVFFDTCGPLNSVSA